MFGGDEIGAMVIDLGTSYTKVGFSGEDMPKAVFNTCIGTSFTSCPEPTPLRSHLTDDDMDTTSTSIATTTSTSHATGMRKIYHLHQSVYHRRDECEIEYPIKHGLIEDWDAVERLWSYAFGNHLRVQEINHPIMVCEPTINTMDRREKLTELIFEKHQHPAMFMCKNAVLSTFASGKSTALVVDSGGGITITAPVFEGYVLNRGIQQTHIAGDALNQILENQLFTAHNRTIIPQYQVQKQIISDDDIRTTIHTYPKTSSSYHRLMQLEILRDIKETICRMSEVPFDPVASARIPTQAYELPDGNTLDIGIERFTVPETLFIPSTESKSIDPQFAGIDRMCITSVDTCDPDIRKELYGQVIMAGGTCLFPGFTARLAKELTRQISTVHKVKILTPATPPERRFATWIGGSILSSLGTFHQMWISRAEYAEHGASIIHKKCPP